MNFLSLTCVIFLQRMEAHQPDDCNMDNSINQNDNEASNSSFSDDAEGLSHSQDTSTLDISLQFHDYSSVQPTASSIRHQCEQIQPDVSSKRSQTDCVIANNDQPTPLPRPVVITCEVNLQVDRPYLTFDDISKNDSKVMFYTGIPDSVTFRAFFDELESGMTKQSDNRRPRSLRMIDELMLVFMRLGLGLLLEDLSDRFRISVSACGSIFNRWIDYLDVQLEFLVQWP